MLSTKSCFQSLRPLFIITIGVIVLTSELSCKSFQRSKAPATRANPETKRVLGNFKRVEGTEYLMAAIGSGGSAGYSYIGSYSYSYSGDVYNYVFFNTLDSSVNTLLPNNDYLIAEATFYPESNNNGKDTPPTKWFLYRLIKKDSNQDGRLSYNDLETLAISDAGGKNYSEVISDVSLIFGRALRDENTLIIIYLKNLRKFYSVIDLVKKEISLTRELPSVGSDVQ